MNDPIPPSIPPADLPPASMKPDAAAPPPSPAPPPPPSSPAPALPLDYAEPPVAALAEPAPDDGFAAFGLGRWMTLIGTGIFVSTMAQPSVLGRLPLQFLLKNELHVSPTKMAFFFAMATSLWNIKPLAGLLSDAVPLMGTRRRHYLLASSAMAAILWMVSAGTTHSYALLACAVIAMNVGLMMASTVSGGLLVSVGQDQGATGRLSSLRSAAMNAAVLLAGPAGGFLAGRWFGWTAGVGAILCIALFIVAFALLREKRHTRVNRTVAADMWRQIRVIFRSRVLWWAVAMLLLVQIAPGFGTPLFYYQTSTLKFSGKFIGLLAFISGSTGLLGALIYGLVCRRLNLRTLLVGGILCNVLSTIFYLGYRSHPTAMLIEGGAGLVAALAQLPLFDLAARATPRGSEAIGYALMMSVMNIGMALSDVIGSWLFQHYQLNFKNLVWINAGSTAAVLLVVPLLPRVLVGAREGEQGRKE